MTEERQQIQPHIGAIAPLANIAISERAVSRVMSRDALDPGLVGMYGPSGYGKSVAAAWIKARHRAYYVQADDFWSKKTMLIAIGRAIGLAETKATAFDMANLIKEQLEKSQRLLIIDEFDFIVEKKLVEAVRSLYEGSKAAILIIGEEALPYKIKKFERFDGRVLDWFAAEPVGLPDARQLAAQKCQGIQIADDLLEKLVEIANGSVRRVGNNLSIIAGEAMSQGWSTVDMKTWGKRTLQTGEAPRRGA